MVVEPWRRFCTAYFDWYNREHRHSGIAFLTPEVVYRGRAPAVLSARQAVLDRAFADHPLRFANRRPVVAALPNAVYINPPKTEAEHPHVVVADAP